MSFCISAQHLTEDRRGRRLHKLLPGGRQVRSQQRDTFFNCDSNGLCSWYQRTLVAKPQCNLFIILSLKDILRF